MTNRLISRLDEQSGAQKIKHKINKRSRINN